MISPAVLFMLMAGFLTGCAKNTSYEIEKIHAVLYRLIDADNRSDLETILNAYSDSIEFYPAGKAFIQGISTVKKNYETLLKAYKMNLQTQILETQLFSDHALVTGINKGFRTSLDDSVQYRVDDKYIALMVRNKKGDWKIDKLIWGLYH